MKKAFLEIGQVVTTHGIRGEVRIYPWCDSPQELANVKVLYLNQGKKALEVQASRVHKNVVVTKFAGIDSVEEARTLHEQILFANRDDLTLEPGEYFIQDIIGLRVIDADTGEEYGALTDVSKTGANDVYHIGPARKNQKLIPAIPDVIIEVDLSGGVMKIRPLKGLFDDAH